jgi:hypothetical protein
MAVGFNEQATTSAFRRNRDIPMNRKYGRVLILVDSILNLMVL